MGNAFQRKYVFITKSTMYNCVQLLFAKYTTHKSYFEHKNYSFYLHFINISYLHFVNIEICTLIRKTNQLRKNYFSFSDKFIKMEDEKKGSGKKGPGKKGPANCETHAKI